MQLSSVWDAGERGRSGTGGCRAAVTVAPVFVFEGAERACFILKLFVGGGGIVKRVHVDEGAHVPRTGCMCLHGTQCSPAVTLSPGQIQTQSLTHTHMQARNVRELSKAGDSFSRELLPQQLLSHQANTNTIGRTCNVQPTSTHVQN